eukprot:4520237-Pleurochrysis_carterae.AAC.1
MSVLLSNIWVGAYANVELAARCGPDEVAMPRAHHVTTRALGLSLCSACALVPRALCLGTVPPCARSHALHEASHARGHQQVELADEDE